MKRKQSYPFSFFRICFAAILLFALSNCSSSKSTAGASTKGGDKKVLAGKEKMDFDYIFYNGNKEKLLGNYDLAETLFSQALRIDPNSAATMYELANIYSFQNNKNQALFFSKKAAVADPKNIWYQLLYADCLKENKQAKELTEVYEGIVKNNPDRIDLYYELANSYLFSNKPNDAIKTYNKIEERVGVSEEGSMQKLKIYKALKNFDKSVEEAEKLIKYFPKEAKYYGILGEIYQEKGMGEKALASYNDLLKVDPTNAYVHLSIADYYRNIKQNEKAFEEIKIAFKSKELDIDTKIKILLSYYSITESYPDLKSDADELCKIVVAVHPDEPKAFSMYGDFLYRDKKLEEARAAYRKAVELDKEKYALWGQLMLIDSELNDIAALEKDSKEAIESFPNQPIAYYYNGLASSQLKKYKNAIDVFTIGKDFVFDDKIALSQFYSGIGDAQNQLGNHSASDSAYDEALELNPAYTYVLNNYAYYLSLRNKNLDKAETMSKKSNDLEPDNQNFQDTYGWILYQMKKYEDAKTWIGKAIESAKKLNGSAVGSGTLLEHFGDVLFQLGQPDEAVKSWMDAKKAGGASDLIDKKIADKKLYE